MTFSLIARSGSRRFASALVVVGLVFGVTVRPVAGQGAALAEMAQGVVDVGWWDDSGELDTAELDLLVAQNGRNFAFLVTPTAMEVEGSTASASELLAQGVLRQLPADSPVHTVIMTAADVTGGASLLFSRVELAKAIEIAGDEASISSRLALIAETLTSGEAMAQLAEESSTASLQPALAQSEAGLFSTGQWVILALIVAGIVGIVAAQLGLRKRRRTVHTAPARLDTSTSISNTSDLILELEPRVTIANDPDLKTRFTEASRTFIDVQEQLRTAKTGHEVADLRLDMAQANWRLEVIEAELDGTKLPPQPHTRDTSGSAWDSTRGSGAQ